MIFSADTGQCTKSEPKSLEKFSVFYHHQHALSVVFRKLHS